MVVLAGRRHRVGTIAARHSDRVDVVLIVLVTPQSGFAALVEWYVAQTIRGQRSNPRKLRSKRTHPPSECGSPLGCVFEFSCVNFGACLIYMY